MTQVNGDRFVTWKAFISTAVTVTVLAGSLAAYMLSAHADQPHSDAATVREMRELRQDIRELRTELRALRQHLDNR